MADSPNMTEGQCGVDPFERTADPGDESAAYRSRILGLMRQRQRLGLALAAMLDRYVTLAESGDCGRWNPEEEAEVIAARSALHEWEAAI
jgi:hypothetical protein